MFKISDFAKMNGVTVKALRYYEEMELLLPIKVNRFSGYRYYSAQQIKTLRKIVLYKELGFSLKDIKELLTTNSDPNLPLDMIHKQIKETQEIIQKQTQSLLLLEQLKDSFEKEENEMYDYSKIVVKKVESTKVASLRTNVSDYALQGQLWGKLISYILEKQAKVVLPCTAIYRSNEHEEDGINLELTACVSKDIPDHSSIQMRTLEEIPQAVCIIHEGDESTLLSTYENLQRYIEENNYLMSGPIREVHIEGYFSNPNPQEHITEIQVPVVKKSN